MYAMPDDNDAHLIYGHYYMTLEKLYSYLLLKTCQEYKVYSVQRKIHLYIVETGTVLAWCETRRT